MGVTCDNIMSGYLSSSVFLELNIALLASAACERMFSVAGRVLVPCPTSMSDEPFKQQ